MVRRTGLYPCSICVCSTHGTRWEALVLGLLWGSHGTLQGDVLESVGYTQPLRCYTQAICVCEGYRAAILSGVGNCLI